MNCIFGLVAFAAMAGFALSPLSARLIGEAHGDRSAQLALAVLAVHALFSLLQGVVGAAYRSVGQFSLLAVFVSTFRLVDGIVLVSAAAAGGGLLAAAIAMVAGRFVTMAPTIAFLHRKHPWLRLGFGSANPTRMRAMLAPSLYYVGYTLGNLVSIQGSIVAIGAVLGPAAVAVAGTTRTLARVGVTAAQMLNQVLLPEYSARFGLSQQRGVTRLITFHLAATAVVILGYLATMLPFGADLYEFWTKSAIGAQGELLTLLVLATAGDMIWTTLQAPTIAANRLRIAGWTYLLASLGGLAILLIFARTLGVNLFGMVALALSLLMIGVAWLESPFVRRLPEG